LVGLKVHHWHGEIREKWKLREEETERKGYFLLIELLKIVTM